MKIRYPVDIKKVRITVKFGQWYFLGKHKGIDYAPINKKEDIEIKAVADWIACEVIWSKFGYGNHVVLHHRDGWTTIYGHQRKITMNPGWERGKAGASIGFMGNTGLSRGKHLHFELRKNNTPVNPAPYFVGY